MLAHKISLFIVFAASISLFSNVSRAQSKITSNEPTHIPDMSNTDLWESLCMQAVLQNEDRIGQFINDKRISYYLNTHPESHKDLCQTTSNLCDNSILFCPSDESAIRDFFKDVDLKGTVKAAYKNNRFCNKKQFVDFVNFLQDRCKDDWHNSNRIVRIEERDSSGRIVQIRELDPARESIRIVEIDADSISQSNDTDSSTIKAQSTIDPPPSTMIQYRGQPSYHIDSNSCEFRFN